VACLALILRPCPRSWASSHTNATSTKAIYHASVQGLMFKAVLLLPCRGAHGWALSSLAPSPISSGGARPSCLDPSSGTLWLVLVAIATSADKSQVCWLHSLLRGPKHRHVGRWPTHLRYLRRNLLGSGARLHLRAVTTQ